MSKAAKEMLGSVFSGLYGIEIFGLRYFNVYGRKQDPASDYAAVIPKFIAKALQEEPVPIEGDGRQTRDFIYIDDVVNANLKALFKKNITGNIFNVASGERTSILDLAGTIVELIGSKSEIMFKPARSGDIRDSVGDIDQAMTQLDFRNDFTIRKGLAETIAWFRRQAGK
jgi:UDP-glucose 4-epimerase